MIFLSHNSKDKSIVEHIAIKLGEIFGRDNVFYDSWSIQPGDEIIDKMNSGLTEMNFFFFFVSRNSLASSMVKLEWQNAIFKASKGQCKFIPVKIDDCVMPTILLQNLYIDFYNFGFEVGLSQIIDVINGKNTFVPSSKEFSNLLATCTYLTKQELKIEISALHFQEPISHYIALFKNDSKDVVLKVTSDCMFAGNQGNGLLLSNGSKYNWRSFSVNRATTPGFPVRASVKTKDGSELLFMGIMKEVKEGKYCSLNCRFITND